jgi:hypothetical protein
MSTLPEPVPESGAAASTVDVCPLCGTRVGTNDERCPECNMVLAGVGTRPPLFSRQSIWWWASALLVIYLVVLAIVVAAR